MINYCGCFQFWPNKLEGKGKYLLPLCSNLRLHMKSVRFKIKFSFPYPFHLFFVDFLELQQYLFAKSR